ncbi:ABC transporter permease [Mobilitalea sibirica]|uniref:ABC transporter permease n=1 Tax=Mobilitalea sibirica TaxID=1462919 RepID=A0A8J7L1V6_9FIRM|nr:ABC transporter permease [Mobilitalea sibirica]MBH1939278.1 ABC transporter permease [Mobilitalea sibirica]
MFYKILKKDFKRKKIMNVILFAFMLTASILIASSTNLLYSTVTAVDYFIEKSNVADLMTLTNSDTYITSSIKDWVKTSDMVKSAHKEDAIMLHEKNVIASNKQELKNTSSLVIMKKPEMFNRIFDALGKDFEVRPSEVAIPVSLQKKMNLVQGDGLRIIINDGAENEYHMDLVVSNIFKDAVLGAELMGMKRIIISDQDFKEYAKHAIQEEFLNFWSFQKTEAYSIRDLENAFSDLLLPNFTIMNKSVISTAYILDLVLAAIMIIFSIFLILISFLILRFTIVFTVMEDYKQIGVMKAIGLKNSKIRGMYSIKYLVLSTVAGIIGYGISIPVSGLLKANISEYILLQHSSINWIVSFASVILVIGITVLFCNYSTRKIKKFSAIDAIRQGNTGERFKKTKKLSLHHFKQMSTPFFMALSDIRSDLKKFVILIITFILGTAVIIIPNNIISTLSSNETITWFGYIKSDFYIRDVIIGNQEKAGLRMQELQHKFQEAGIETTLRADLISNGKLLTKDKKESIGVLGFQGIGISTHNYDYLEGYPPVLENEIAITEKVADALEVGIGDSILCEVQNETKEYIITALFQTFNNLGNAVRLAENYKAEFGSNTSIQISGLFTGDQEEKMKQFNELKATFHDMDIKSGKEVVDSFIGSITKQLGSIKNLILIIVLGVNFLITALLLRMLISKEIPEVALLKSLGFYNLDIKLWQIYRISIILLLSIILGTLLANSTGKFLAGGIFNIMGLTRLSLTIEPLQVYLFYPTLVFTATMLAVLSSLGQIKRTFVWELNHQE